MTKKESLSAEELSELQSFIGECVLKDKAFPTLRVGTDNVTIQELMHDRSLDSIRAFGKSVKDAITKHDPDFSSAETFKIGGFEGDKVVKMLKLIIRYREYQVYLKDARSEKKRLTIELENLSTPEERKEKLKAQLLELTEVEA